MPGLLLRVLGGVRLSGGFREMAKVEAASGAAAPTRCGGSARSPCSVVEDAERLWQKLRLTNTEHERLASMARRLAADRAAAASRRRARCSIGSRRERFTDRVLLAWARSQAPAQSTRLGGRSRRCRSAGRRRRFR